MTKLLLLDKDGTLTYPKSGEKFCKSPTDQALYPNVPAVLSQYRLAGWEVAIATNQGGVAYGFKSIESAITETAYVMELTGIKFAMIAHSYEADGGEAYFIRLDKTGLSKQLIQNAIMAFRKPGSGMIDFLRDELTGGSPSDILFVGDRLEDRNAASAARIPFMWADEWREDG